MPIAGYVTEELKIEVRAVLRPQIWKFIGVTMISWDHCTFGLDAANDAHTVWVNTACKKEHSQKNLSKPILWYRIVYNQIGSVVWETDNPVRKLRTDKQINVLIRAIFEHLGFTR